MNALRAPGAEADPQSVALRTILFGRSSRPGRSRGCAGRRLAVTGDDGELAPRLARGPTCGAATSRRRRRVADLSPSRALHRRCPIYGATRTVSAETGSGPGPGGAHRERRRLPARTATASRSGKRRRDGDLAGLRAAISCSGKGMWGSCADAGSCFTPSVHMAVAAEPLREGLEGSRGGAAKCRSKRVGWARRALGSVQRGAVRGGHAPFAHVRRCVRTQWNTARSVD